VLQAFADEVRTAGALPDAISLGLDVSSEGARSLDVRTEKPASAALRKRALALLDRVPKLRGLTLGPQGAAELIGEPAIADAAGPAGLSRARFRTRADLFAQANRAATPLLIAAALDALGDAISGRVVELYCGSGTFTLPLLERAAQVTAVEFAAASLDLLRKSAAEAALDAGGKLRLVAGDAAKVALPAADAVLLDPPRTGAAAAMEKVAALGARRIAYVSCDAPTLARDAKALAARGYRLERVVPLDLFPQTAHLEAVASFSAR
jgi:23S rRNA (uracil1939-C5)-methyltransferase